MIAARADASNRHRVGRQVLRALGPDGIVVNIARGSIIDEDALIDLLRLGDLGGAGLDVFEREPTVPDALKAIPHVVLAPHIGGGTTDAHEAMQDLVVANVTAFLAGEPVRTPVPEMSA
jgi:glyoxylate reductase